MDTVHVHSYLSPTQTQQSEQYEGSHDYFLNINRNTTPIFVLRTGEKSKHSSDRWLRPEYSSWISYACTKLMMSIYMWRRPQLALWWRQLMAWLIFFFECPRVKVFTLSPFQSSRSWISSGGAMNNNVKIVIATVSCKCAGVTCIPQKKVTWTSRKEHNIQTRTHPRAVAGFAKYKAEIIVPIIWISLTSTVAWYSGSTAFLLPLIYSWPVSTLLLQSWS